MIQKSVINLFFRVKINVCVTEETGKYIKAYQEDTTVIYFIDLDDHDTNYETKKLFEDIKKYCKTHAYELVFFAET